MLQRTTRLRWRRKFRKSRRQVEDISIQAEDNLERHFIRRLGRLFYVRRFVLSWLTLLTILGGVLIVQVRSLSPYYQELKPVPGGTYVEGVLGAFTNANPLFSISTVDNSVSNLIFSGLFKYDQQNKLSGDLAKTIKILDNGKRYEVTLRDNLFWHDGNKLTAEDVVFTYQLIKNPDTRSPHFSSWKDVKISLSGEKTIVFVLPNSLASFKYSLTNGIVPKHILNDVAVEQLRSTDLNTINPIGSGPFKWDTIEVRGDSPDEREELIGLVGNDAYHFGAPKLQRFVIRTFRNEESLLKSFEARELNAIVGVSNVPDTIVDQAAVRVNNIPLTGALMVFFRNTQDILKDVEVRRALTQAIDTKKLISGLEFSAIPVDGPFLKSHFSYNNKVKQLAFNRSQAEKRLNNSGWKLNKDGVRQKKGKELKLLLYAQNSSEFSYVTNYLQEQWSKIGVKIEVVLPEENEFQTTVAVNHSYDMVLYGISLGTDPDVFAYWHSSQADVRSNSRLNLSEYSSDTADESLEAGRTRLASKLRTVKYDNFLNGWRNNAPALALYQPRFLYVVRGGLFNFEPQSINTLSDRYSNVHNWMSKQAKVNIE
jgi:peptide/nickel transport system substrate-binding protein